MAATFQKFRRTPSVSNASEFSEISTRTNGDEPIFMDVYRESQLNGFRRLGRRNGNGKFIQEDADDDSGFIEKSQISSKPSPTPNHSLEKMQLDRRCLDLCRELRTVCKLTEDFRRDVAGEQISSSDLLVELGSKIRPYLVRLDEEMSIQEEIVKKNLDQCKIADQKVDWLLRHNTFMLEFRRLVERLTTGVFDELENLLRLKVRGVYGAALKNNVAEKLSEIIKILDEVEDAVNIENSQFSSTDRFKSAASLRSA